MNKQINTGEIVIYQMEGGQASLEVNLVEDTVWLDTHQMAELFQRDRTVIVRHVRNIYKTSELLRGSTCAKIAQVAQDGKKRVMDFYNLDMIISVGYRVNSLRGTQFRIWANRILKDYLVISIRVHKILHSSADFSCTFYRVLEFRSSLVPLSIPLLSFFWRSRHSTGTVPPELSF
ncbi:hypothetical protein ES708_07400 [subsurface metagenome]